MGRRRARGGRRPSRPGRPGSGRGSGRIGGRSRRRAARSAAPRRRQGGHRARRRRDRHGDQQASGHAHPRARARTRRAGRRRATGDPRAMILPRLGGRRVTNAAMVAATVLGTWLTATRLHVSTDMAALFPDSGDAAALARFTRAFGGRDPAILLVRGERPSDVAQTAAVLSRSLREKATIAQVLDRAPEPETPPDPTLAWVFAGPVARAR